MKRISVYTEASQVMEAKLVISRMFRQEVLNRSARSKPTIYPKSYHNVEGIKLGTFADPVSESEPDEEEESTLKPRN